MGKTTRRKFGSARFEGSVQGCSERSDGFSDRNLNSLQVTFAWFGQITGLEKQLRGKVVINSIGFILMIDVSQ
jgi:hypothetical protein